MCTTMTICPTCKKPTKLKELNREEHDNYSDLVTYECQDCKTQFTDTDWNASMRKQAKMGFVLL